jgi:hypothetical protein
MGQFACVNNSPELPKIELSLSSNKILGTPNALRIFELNFLLLIEIMYHQYYQCFFFVLKCVLKLSDSKFASSSNTPDIF